MLLIIAISPIWAFVLSEENASCPSALKITIDSMFCSLRFRLSKSFVISVLPVAIVSSIAYLIKPMAVFEYVSTMSLTSFRTNIIPKKPIHKAPIRKVATTGPIILASRFNFIIFLL